MTMDWHRQAARHVKAYRRELAHVPTALFITAASLTDAGQNEVQSVPIVKDPWLAKPPKTRGKRGRKERYALSSRYLGDVLKAGAPLRPRTATFCGGSLDLTTMNTVEQLFVLLVVDATPDDGATGKQSTPGARGCAGHSPRSRRAQPGEQPGRVPVPAQPRRGSRTSASRIAAAADAPTIAHQAGA